MKTTHYVQVIDGVIRETGATGEEAFARSKAHLPGIWVVEDATSFAPGDVEVSPGRFQRPITGESRAEGPMIRGLPVPCEITIDHSGRWIPVEDGEADLSDMHPGTYRVDIRGNPLVLDHSLYVVVP